MEGRKAVGGKLEIKIRIRDPFINKQVDETKEKWLVIDDFIRKPSPVSCDVIQQFLFYNCMNFASRFSFK